MEDGDNKLGFFSDIRKNFILIIGGIVSLTTVIPAFLNQTSEIFGWKHMSSGYCTFIFVYFIVPYLFYLFYCSIHDYVGFLELLPAKQSERFTKNKYSKILVELLVVTCIFLYLVFPGYFFNKWISILLILFPIGCFLAFAFKYRNEKLVHLTWKEFVLIGSPVIIIFGLFFIGTFRQEDDTHLFPYSTKDQQSSFAAFDLRNNLKKDYTDVMDAARTVAYKYRLQAGGFRQGINTVLSNNSTTDYASPYFTDIYNSLYAIDKGQDLEVEFVVTNASKLKAAVDQLLLYDKKLLSGSEMDIYRVNQIDETCYGFYNYSVAIQQANLAIIDLKWAKQLKVLQFKSLCWFFFLILLGLCLWFKMQVKLKQLPESEDTVPATLITDNISQVKSLILLLFILIVPWFRQLNAKDVDLEKPFLNISLSGLANGEYHPPVQVVFERTKDMPNSPTIAAGNPIANTQGVTDTIKISNTVAPPIYHTDPGHYSDPMLATINRNIQNINGNIHDLKLGTVELAKRIIGNPTDVKLFEKKLKEPKQ